MILRSLVLALVLLAGSPVPAAEIAIVGARILPSPDVPAIDRGTVLVRDDRIVAVGPAGEVAVPEGARVIDAGGKVLAAGFWNSHVHLLAPELGHAPAHPAAEVEAVLREMFTRWGFTTVFDIASFGNAPALRARIDAGEVAGPDILTVDVPFFPEGGTPIYVRALLESLHAPSAEVADAAEGAARAERQLAAGADGVKLFAGAIVGGEVGVLPMDVDIGRAVVDAAHRAGKPAFAHPSNAAGMEVALAAGVDVLAHTAPQMGPWDPALVARLRARDVALTPTLTLFEVEARKEGLADAVRESMLRNAITQMRAFADAGGTVLFGTDVGYIDEVDTRREFALMARAGMDWTAILASLTTVPAARFGQGDDKGRVAPGMRADLVLLGSDPADDVAAFSDVVMTLKDGRVLHGD
jgi:imidazolonepropionase-like amidohydrolase